MVVISLVLSVATTFLAFLRLPQANTMSHMRNVAATMIFAVALWIHWNGMLVEFELPWELGGLGVAGTAVAISPGNPATWYLRRGATQNEWLVPWWGAIVFLVPAFIAIAAATTIYRDMLNLL